MGSKPALLVVEDEASIRELIRDVLEPIYEVTFATCQAECYELLKAPAYHVVLLDLRLPREPGDMNPANQIGIDILKQIRARRLVKRDSALPIPVVVMTAYGDDRLTSDLLTKLGANDYLPKPFGENQELERTLDSALCGEGALVSTATLAARTVRLRFHPTTATVRIETLVFDGADHELLNVLREMYERDLQQLVAPEDFKGLAGSALADRLDIDDKSLRQRVTRFRQRVAESFRSELMRALDDNDIIQNERRRDGYRLNPFVVRIVAWDR